MRTVTQAFAMRCSWAMAAVAMTLLTGCASLRLVDSDVVSVAAIPPGMSLQGTKYRFERLPSQANNPEAGLAEQHAQAAMTAVGLVRDDAGASLSVMVGFSGAQYLADPWGRPVAAGWTPYGRLAFGSGFGSHIGWGMGMRFPPPTHYRREVSIILRDLKSGQVVYETRASHAGPWSDSEAIFATLFQAALANFPNPPAGQRRVNIELPR